MLLVALSVGTVVLKVEFLFSSLASTLVTSFCDMLEPSTGAGCCGLVAVGGVELCCGEEEAGWGGYWLAAKKVFTPGDFSGCDLFAGGTFIDGCFLTTGISLRTCPTP